MKKSEAIQSFWGGFCAVSKVDPNGPYQSWFFGNSSAMARELAELVISGKKFATASLAEANELQPDEAPVADGYSVVTDFEGNPRCVIQTTEIRHVPFNEVDAQFASDEGEGDQSLEYWRRAHSEYFSKEAPQLGIVFNETSMICCERFILRFVR